MSEADLCAVLLQLSRRDWSAEIARWVHGTGELPIKELLEQHGVAVLEEPAQMAHTLGLRVTEGGAIAVKTVLRSGVAERAGFAAGDEWIGVETGTVQDPTAWRITRLDDLALYLVAGSPVRALVARDRRLLRLPFVFPEALTSWRLAVRDSKQVSAWFSG